MTSLKYSPLPKSGHSDYVNVFSFKIVKYQNQYKQDGEEEEEGEEDGEKVSLKTHAKARGVGKNTH